MIEPISYDQIDPQTVRIGWKDGSVDEFKARELRLACPCASCVDENTGSKILDPTSVAVDISIADCDLVGRYAFQFHFSDKHNTGIFSFDILQGMRAS